MPNHLSTDSHSKKFYYLNQHQKAIACGAHDCNKAN